MKELKKNKSPGLITQYFYFKIDLLFYQGKAILKIT